MRAQIQTLIENTLKALVEAGTLPAAVIEPVPAFSIDAPRNPDHGDFACNVAMMLAKPARSAPRKIAEAIVAGLVDPDGVLASAEIAGPGFINLRVNNGVFHKVVGDVLRAGDVYGRATAKNGKTAQVEFVSANPTGPLHLGHARGAFLGDAIARVLDAAGYDVHREFYINDAGNQVEVLGRTVHARYRELFGQDVTLEEGQYPGEYVIDIAKALKAEDGDKWLSADEADWLPRCIAFGMAHNLADVKATLETADIRFDDWFSEQTLHDAGDVLGIVERYRARDMVYEAAQARGAEDKKRRDGSNAAKFEGKQLGGTFLKTSDFGDDEDRIVLRAAGTPVYLTADLAYHETKANRGFDRIIDVWGADHAGHVGRIKAGMEALGVDKNRFEFALVQIVKAFRAGEELKFSKRAGQVYTLAELFDEVGADVARFVFLMRSGNSQMSLDMEKLLEQSMDNPVYYLQYGHARMCSILRKAGDHGAAFVGVDGVTDAMLARLDTREDLDLLKKVATLPGVVQGAAARLEPHRVVYFAQELIAGLHSYLGKHRVLGDDAELTQARLALVATVRQATFSALYMLGITAPERMDALPKDD